MRYEANPVVVDAFKIVGVADKNERDGGLAIALENGTNYIASAPMLSRMMPEVGDYLVRQSDGYEYLNPKDVFERKYHQLPDPINNPADLKAVS